MAIFAKLVLFAVPILLLILTAITGYAYSQIRSLSLPIPQALALFTFFLPLITAISTRGAYGIVRRRSPSNEPYQLTIPLIGVIGLQLIFETVVATLSLTHIIPPSSLHCGLHEKWQQLFSAKNGDAVRAIQDAFNCCGLNTVGDRSFPFPNKDHPQPTCSAYFHRTQSCLGPWRKAEQISAGLLLLVAVVVFIIKVLSIISLLTGTTFGDSRWVEPFKQIGGTEDSEEDNRAGVRRLIEERSGTDEGYHDDPSEEVDAPVVDATGGIRDQHPRVEPLPEGGREWRE